MRIQPQLGGHWRDPAGVSEGSGVTSGEVSSFSWCDWIIHLWGRSWGAEGDHGSQVRGLSELHQSDDKEDKQGPSFLERKLTLEQLGSEWCGSTYTWILSSSKHFKSRAPQRTMPIGWWPPIPLWEDAYYGEGKGWRPLPPPVRGQ